MYDDVSLVHKFVTDSKRRYSSALAHTIRAMLAVVLALYWWVSNDLCKV